MPNHLHAYYAEHKATVDIRTCELMESDLRVKEAKLVLAWAELHQDELMANWRLVMNGEESYKIHNLSNKEKIDLSIGKGSCSRQ